jgi:GH35 family endo-1,4-beta-xylanase
VNGDITLAIGLRQPRWPECHIPDIYKDESIEQLYPKLEKFITAVVQRYKNHPSLESYQLENEFFLKAFGKCPDFSRERLNKEFNLVKKIDSNTPIIISLSNNYWGLPIGEPRPDIHGVSIYKRVYDYTVTKSYFEYPFPSWYYTGRAGLTQLFTGKKSMIHELQAEPWAPTSVDKASIEEQDKSMDAKRLKERLAYAKAIGFKKIDLWGGEWWYWRKVRFNDPSLWNTIKNEIPPQNR